MVFSQPIRDTRAVMESIRSEGLMPERHEIVSSIGVEEKIESGNKSADSIGMKVS